MEQENIKNLRMLKIHTRILNSGEKKIFLSFLESYIFVESVKKNSSSIFIYYDVEKIPKNFFESIFKFLDEITNKKYQKWILSHFLSKSMIKMYFDKKQKSDFKEDKTKYDTLNEMNLRLNLINQLKYFE